MCGSRLTVRVQAIVLYGLLAATARAGGPRFVAGSQFTAASPGKMMAFRTSQPLYFTDAGGLGPAVSHAQADAMVAAAATVWNVPTSSLTLAQGGTLAEDVSGANVTLGNAGVVWPADVMSSNSLSVPLAVVYDADGSVTDLLLGAGASAPAGCRQTGVTESVDAFGEAGTIDHAILIVNGRCVSGGAALPQQMLQLQYQLTRAFGRVMGLAWSQLNDNVFTGATAPTLVERQNWPLMHPIDIVCGAYTYQCTVSPFSLREDDIAALGQLYPVTSANLTAGKTLTLQGAVGLRGWVRFPSGEGMDLLNVTVTRAYAGSTSIQPWQVASGVTGVTAWQNRGNPVSGSAPSDTPGLGDWDSPAYFTVGRVDVGADANLWLTTEAINPLYIGEYAIGPYTRPATAPSGSAQTMVGQSEVPGFTDAFWQTVSDAAVGCTPNDGSEGSPAATDPSGWWTGLLCGAGHSSWWSAAVKAGHSWTLEATALDESGHATGSKAQPVIGVWNSGDATGTLPTVAAQVFAMNSMAEGTTQLKMPSTANDMTVRIAVADQFGAGRPDFGYKMRVLYADSVAPSQLGTEGGAIVVTGTGFRSGNGVMVNGVAATVMSWSATQIVATAPPMATAMATAGVAVDVAVVDAGTGGTAVIVGGLTYLGGAPPVRTISIDTAPAYVAAGATGSWDLDVQAEQNGVAATGLSMEWMANGLSLAASQSTTDANGLQHVTATVSDVASGSSNTATACGWSNVCATWTAYGVDVSQWRVGVLSGAEQSVAKGGAFAPVQFQVTDGAGHPLQVATVSVHQDVQAWEETCPAVSRCASAPVLTSTTATGLSAADGSVQVTPLMIAGQPQVVNIVVTSGTAGFVSVTLTVMP